ncbi:TATA-box-binding protein [Anopheles nili]|uniref:TATA-box-binding protein n=1 Tax=Anopheles nili TaxID=185578 RepID=UPI00237A1677|nr:TATA-box-binding protein [Anopheles nili]
MVGSNSFISNAISTTSVPNGISGRSNSNSSIAGTSTVVVQNGTSPGSKTVIDANSVNTASLAFATSNNVVSTAKGSYLRQQQGSTSGVITPAIGNTSILVSPGVTNRIVPISNHKSITSGMINHSSLMFATANHQQQLSVLSNASPVGEGSVERKPLSANIKSTCNDTTTASTTVSSIVASTNDKNITTGTAATTTTISTHAPSTEPDPAGTTELPLETKDAILESEPQEEEPEIDIVINNVVCSFSVRCHLNLHEIARNANNVEFRRENGMVTMKIRRPYTTASIWSSGKITCTGATSEHQAKIAARRYSRCLQKLGFNVRFRNFRIVNVLGTCSMPWGIMIVNFSEKYKKEASYEPELHPGVTYKLQTPKATLKIFSTGSITVTAASVAFVQAAIEQIFPLVYEFRKKRNPTEKLEVVKQPQSFDTYDVDHLIEEDCEGAIAEAEGLGYWNGTSGASQPEEQVDDLETFGDDEDVCTRNNTKAIHKINSIRQNGKKRRMRQFRPSGRAINDGDSMSDDELCVSDID